MRTWTLALALSLLIAAPASGFVVQERGGLASPTNGIVLGPDGNFWVSEIGTGSIARITPGGAVLKRFTLGAAPTSLAAGPGGRVWASITGADKLTWFDATAPDPVAHDISTGAPGDCGPVAIADGGNGRMYVSLPNDGGCGSADRLGHIAADGSEAAVTMVAGRGQVFDLAVSGGKLFAPDIGGDVVRRLALNAGLTIESTVNAPGGPDGVTVDGPGRVWVTLFVAGKLARFPAGQNGGAATEVTPAGGLLLEPFGIVSASDGNVYATGRDSGNLVRIGPSDVATFYGLPAGAKPWQIVEGPDADLYFTDLGSPRILRFVNSPPRAITGAATPVAPDVANVNASVNPRGNDTQVVFDYGTTTAYGSTTAPVALPAGADPLPVNVNITGLAPSTTYHVRVRATNGEGASPGADVTVTTPAGFVDRDNDGSSPPADCNDTDPNIKPGARDTPGDKIDQDCNGRDAAFRRLVARASFAWQFSATFTRVTSFKLTGLSGGERARITCSGRGCPLSKRTVKKLKKGTRNLTKLVRGAKLRPGAKLTVRITKKNRIGIYAQLVVRSGKNPRLKRGCLPPGSKKVSRC